MRHTGPNEPFFDRNYERKNIPELIRSKGNQTQVIVLAGTTGVGKSSLVEKLLRDELTEYMSVIVRMGKSSVGTIENLSYFNALYQAIANAARHYKGYTLKTPNQYGRKNIFNWLRLLWSAVKNRFHVDPTEHIYEPFEEHSVSRKKEYILSTLQKGPFIISVQNIQNIDTQSAELFQSISKKTHSLIWILEYTIPKEGKDEKFYNFINEWKGVGDSNSLYEIEKLDFELAYNLVPPEIKDPKHKKRLEAQYEKEQGNLLSIMVVPRNLDKDENYIRSKLQSLNQDEKYIVYILYLNETPIPESVLYSIMTKVDEQGGGILFIQQKANDFLEKLVADNIILDGDEGYSIKHDSLRTALSQLPPEPSLFLAFRALEGYYKTIFDQKDGNKENYIKHLFSLYVRFHDQNLVSLFPALQEQILAAKYPKEIIQKIEEYKCHILKNGGTDLHILYPVARFLTELCIRLQYVDEAQENLNLINNIRPSQYLIGLQGAICALRSSQENWELLNTLIANSKEGSRLRLSLCLCRLRIMMRSCDSDQSKNYAEKLMAYPAYRSIPEYGFLIYNYAEFAETPTEALRYYRQALQIFQKYNMVNIQAEVNISMCMSYSYAGQLKKARSAIQRAIKLAPQKIPEYVLLNNSAAIDILDSNISSSVLNRFADAALMSTNPYEVLIIKCNWLIGLVLSGRMNQAADLANEIETSNFEVYQYEDFLHILYQDLYFYYTKAENNERANLYANKLMLLSERKGINESTRTLIKLMLQKKQIPTNFYSQFPFRVDFLGFWGLVISPDLENSQ